MNTRVEQSVVGEWVLLSYRLPRDPSTPRITLWRRLRRLGAQQIGDGLVALPADARTREQFEWLADAVVEAGGVAGVWLARPSSMAQERGMAAAMATARAAEYDAITADAACLLTASEAEQNRMLAKLRRTWRDVSRRDYFPPRERDTARSALDSLTDSLTPDPSEGRRSRGRAPLVEGVSE